MMWDLQKFSNRIAAVDENGIKITYSELKSEGDKLAAAIGGRVLVASLCQNSIGSLLGYSSFINNGIVPFLVSAALDRDLLDNLLQTYCPKFIWLPRNLVSKFSGMEAVYSAYDYTLLKTNFAKEYKLNDELALLLTTSGSTGSPKFVRQSYKNILANTHSIINYLKITENEKPITTLPMNYTYGLSIVNTHLMVGATILLTEKSLMQKEFWSFFKEQQATSFGGVPYTYEMLKRLRFLKMDLPSLKTMTQAGGKLLPELHKEFAEYASQKKIDFVVMYGAAEATARMGYLPSEKAIEKCGSMGIAIPGGSLSLVDENDVKITATDTVGELVYKGENVTLGYAESGEDLAKGDERNGVYHTGDMAKFDKDGFYYVVGRKKRFLKIYGNRVNLDEIDRLIKAQFEGVECASSGVDDRMYIFITDEKVAEDVKTFVVKKTGLNHAAFNVVALEVIPKNDSGKTLYKELEKYFK